MASSKPVLLLLADTDETIEKQRVQDKVEIITCPDLETGVTPDQWSRVEYIITSHLYKVDKPLQDKCPRLKAVVRLGIGVDNIDIQAASQSGICVCNVPDYGIEEVADTTFALILALFRQTTFLHQFINAGEVHHTFTDFTTRAQASRRMRGKTLGLIGMGNIGTAVCIRAKAFGMDVKIYDPYLRPGTDKSLGIVQVPTLKELISESHCVSLHCPLTPETRHIINTDTLKYFKKDAFIVNTSRGAQIDEAALSKALRNGELAGAALDVQVTEPFQYKGSVFEGVPNLILTPHAGWFSKESYEDVRNGAISVVEYCLNNSDSSKIPNCLNKRNIDMEKCTKRWQ